MIGVETAFALYAILATIAFALLPLRRAITLAYAGGWLLLPVGPFPPQATGFTVALIGGALPASNMLLAKAWVVPVTTLALAAITGRRRIVRPWPGRPDLAMLLWCAWPLVAAAWIPDPAPAPALAACYLAGTWGAPWLLARLFLADAAGREGTLAAIATAGLLAVPAALVEATGAFAFYRPLYGVHPFAVDGATRYVGLRPLLLFENGNQYGIAIAVAAVAAVAAWRIAGGAAAGARALVLVAAALASQSVGAILLGGAGIVAILARARLAGARPVLLAGALVLTIAAPVYLSGVLPIERVVRHTAAGQRLLAAVRATGRGSIAWRVSQDLKVLPLVRAHPIAGAQRWDWWRPARTRPWGLAMLILGQFGLVGLGLAGATVLAPAIRAWRAPAPVDEASFALAVVALIAALDAVLNAFVFLPALLAAGAAAAPHVMRRGRRAASAAARSADAAAAPPAAPR